MNARSSRCFPSRLRKAALLLFASSALLLTGCLASDKLATFKAGDAPAGEPRALPAFCEQILQPVKVPPVTGKTYAPLAYTRTADALDEANDRLTVGGMCIRDERQDYAGKGGN